MCVDGAMNHLVSGLGLESVHERALARACPSSTRRPSESDREWPEDEEIGKKGNHLGRSLERAVH